MRFLGQYGLLFWGVLLCGCGPKFDPPDQLSTLRVLGVQKDLPYAQPGQTVNLQMLWEDASPSAGRPIQITWSEPCANPDGDLYYSCFTPDKLPTLLPNPALGQTDFPHGDTTQVTFVASPSIPEPPSLLLLAGGFGFLALRRALAGGLAAAIVGRWSCKSSWPRVKILFRRRCDRATRDPFDVQGQKDVFRARVDQRSSKGPCAGAKMLAMV